MKPPGRRHRKLCTQQLFELDVCDEDGTCGPNWLPCDDAVYNHDLGKLKKCTVDIKHLFARPGLQNELRHTKRLLRSATNRLKDKLPKDLNAKLPYFNKLQMAYHGPTGLSISNATAPPQNPSCEPGLQAVAVDATYCLPCERRPSIFNSGIPTCQFFFYPHLKG